MDYQANAITIIKNEEFLLLLAAAGAENWYGIDLSKEKEALEGDRAFNASLASLYQKHIVDWAGGKARIADPYRRLFRTLRDARVCIMVTSDKRPGHVKACYCGDGCAAVVERRTSSDDEVEVSLQSAAGWMSDIIEAGILPDDAGTPEGGHISYDAEEPCCRFELRKVSDGSLLESIAVYESGLYAEARFTGREETSEDYSPDRICEILKEWIGGAA